MIKRGSRVRVVKMDTAGGMDWQAKRLEGKVFTVRYIDSAEQIHIEEAGIALIPGVDEYSFFFGQMTYVSLHRSINHLIFISPDAGWRRTDDGRSFWGPNNA